MSNQVWVCGEVVIDLIPDGTERKAVVGGGPANTAKALSKLGIATQFIDGISSDKYGQMATKLPKNYTPSAKEKYMCAKHKEYFRRVLEEWKKEKNR